MTQSGPPAFTPEQRAAALAKAGEARRLRAEVKELLKTGSVTLIEVLARGETEDYIGGMKVESVLESLPGSGKDQDQAPHGGAGNRFEQATAGSR